MSAVQRHATTLELEEDVLEASAETLASAEESYDDERHVKRHDSSALPSKQTHGSLGFTAPRVIDAPAGSVVWVPREKENSQPSVEVAGSGWSSARPSAKAPPGIPPPAALAAAANKKPAPRGPPPKGMASLQSSSATTSSSAKPYSIADESDLDEDEDEDEVEEHREQEAGPVQHVTTLSDEAALNDDEAGDDVIKTPIVRSSFEKYIEEKKASGITLPRKSGRYDDDENGGTAANGKAKFKGAFPYVLVSHDRGSRSDHVQCTIYRDRSTMHTKMYPEYQLVLDDTKKPLILARKMSLNMTSNYHMFDLTRGVAGSKLSKKSGNYLGKLRALNAARTEYVVVTNSSGREEMGGVIFERLTVLDQLKAGSQPRKLTVLVPALDVNNVPVPNRPDSGDVPVSTLLKNPSEASSAGMFVLESKMPSYENGNYRLNFHGRVNLPSVKNFQLVMPADVSDVVCQFGKVNDDKFHLDFKAPLNAFQAFSIALTQFVSAPP